MPHLSPMNWIIAPTLYLLFLLPVTISFLWWSQMIYFPAPTQTSNPKMLLSNNWNWK